MAKWKWMAMGNLPASGWTPPSFQVTFEVEASDEEGAIWIGRNMMHMGRPHVTWKEVEVEIIEGGNDGKEDSEGPKVDQETV